MMKKNLLTFYVTPRVEELTYVNNAFLCLSGDLSAGNESFTEGDAYQW